MNNINYITLPIHQFVCVELANKDNYPNLYTIVVKHMMYGICGVLKPKECVYEYE